VKLQPKGENGFIEFQHTPSVRASAEANVVLAAYHMALETVLLSVTAENNTSAVRISSPSGNWASRSGTTWIGATWSFR